MKKALLLFSLLILFVGCEKKTISLVKTTAEIITIDSTLSEKAAYNKLIAPYKKQNDCRNKYCNFICPKKHQPI